MMAQINNAINNGKSAVATPVIIAVAVVAVAAVAIDIINKCFNIDVVAEIKKWIMDRFEALKKKLFPGPADENSKVGKMIKAIKAAYQKLMGYVSDIKEWIMKAVAKVQEVINWVQARIDKLIEWINNPCARAALGSLPAGTAPAV